MKFEEIGDMDPNSFERLVAATFIELGYSVNMTKKTRDGGVDIVLECHMAEFGDWIRYVVQVKRYKKAASVNVVRELKGILDIWDADKNIFLKFLCDLFYGSENVVRV